jgi:hypothetical protein
MVYVVERYLPGLTRSDLLRSLARLEQEAGDEAEVRYLGSTIVLQDEACFCQFEGRSEAAVAEANRRAGLTFDRIVPAVTVNTSRRGAQMDVSTTVPTHVRIGRPRLYSLAALAAIVGVALWAIFAFTGGSGSHTAMTKAEQQYMNAISSLSPATLRAAFGTPSNADLQSAQDVQEIVSLTPVQLIEAFGTDVRAAAALASLAPQERQHVEAIMTLTPAQLRAAFGTSK